MKRFKLKTFTVAAVLLIGSSAARATDFIVQPGDYLRISIEKKNAQFAKFAFSSGGQAKEQKIHFQPFQEKDTQILVYSEMNPHDVQLEKELLNPHFSLHRQGEIVTLDFKGPVTDHHVSEPSIDSWLDYEGPGYGGLFRVDVPSQVQFLLKNSKIQLIRNQQPLAESILNREIYVPGVNAGKFPVVFVLRENDLILVPQPSNGGEDTGGDNTGTGGDTGENTGGDIGDNGGTSTGGDTDGGENTGGNPDENNPPPSGGCGLATQAVGSSAMLTAALASLGGLFWVRRRTK